jgi:hypothetical protein
MVSISGTGVGRMGVYFASCSVFERFSIPAFSYGWDRFMVFGTGD